MTAWSHKTWKFFKANNFCVFWKNDPSR